MHTWVVERIAPDKSAKRVARKPPLRPLPGRSSAAPPLKPIKQTTMATTTTNDDPLVDRLARALARTDVRADGPTVDRVQRALRDWREDDFENVRHKPQKKDRDAVRGLAGGADHRPTEKGEGPRRPGAPRPRATLGCC